MRERNPAGAKHEVRQNEENAAQVVRQQSNAPSPVDQAIGGAGRPVPVRRRLRYDSRDQNRVHVPQHVEEEVRAAGDLQSPEQIRGSAHVRPQKNRWKRNKAMTSGSMKRDR